MRLVYITNGVGGSGGLERVLSTKTDWFVNLLKYDIFIITLNEGDNNKFFDFNGNIKFYNIDCIFSNKLSNYLYYIKEVNRLVGEIQPDVVLVCDDGVKGLFIPIWLKSNAKIIYERHAVLHFNNVSRFIRWVMVKTTQLYDAFVVLTPACKQDWGNKDHIIVIPNPLSYLPTVHSDLSAKRAICVGSLSHNKGYDLLIAAWAKVAMEVPDWKIDIYGRGDSQGLMDIATQLNVSQSINFRGQSDSIENEYLSSNFLILPSRTEGFGMVLIEAMSYGLPCVAFDCPNGPRYIINENENGFLAKNGDVDDLAKQIKKMISLSEDQHMTISLNAKKSILRYDMQHIGMVWHRLFQHLVKPVGTSSNP